jgi:DNA-binding response OmpR family regulator
MCSPLTKKQIALVDDSSPFALLVKQIFEDSYHVDTYSSATEFMSLISRIAGYHLIILDINMPGMDGLEALQRLKGHETTRNIPILLLTGDSRKDTVLKGMKLGAADYMVKPIDPVLLEERVINLLGSPG